jgi:hypothetical protein
VTGNASCGADGASVVEGMDPGATIEAWRANGGHRLDPVRFRFLGALARRAADQHGAARRILDDRLATLLAAYAVDLEKARRADDADAAVPPRQADRSPLAQLTDHIALHAPSQRDELKTLAWFQNTCSRLSADRRMTQSMAKVPEDAGPLNSHGLVHRSLALMRELSPGYLHRFMSHVDALLWIEQANSAAAPTAADNPRPESQKKTPRGKAGKTSKSG